MHPLDAVGAGEGGLGPGGAHEGEFAAQSVGAQAQAELGGVFEDMVRHVEATDAGAGAQNAVAQKVFRVAPLGGEAGGIAVELVAAADDGDAGGNVLGRLDVDAEAEAVEQLRTEFALLRGCRCRRGRSGPGGGC